MLDRTKRTKITKQYPYFGYPLYTNEESFRQNEKIIRDSTSWV